MAWWVPAMEDIDLIYPDSIQDKPKMGSKILIAY
jgi:hypothetical protein